jgi:MYXO-CTERM domain-containing protein
VEHIPAKGNSRAGLSLMGFVCCLFATVSFHSSASAATCIEFYDAEKVGEFASDAISESSGLALSGQHEGILWTHNDSGDSPRIFAFGQNGEARGMINLGGASARDWEAMGIGPCGTQTCLYIGDIGDNNAERDDITIWRIVEPTPTGSATSQIATAEGIRVLYPDGAQDSEGIAVDPLTGDLLLIEKSFTAEARVYLLPADAWVNRDDEAFTLLPLGEIDFDTDSFTGGLVTGLDIAPSGVEAFARTYAAGFHIPLDRDSGGQIQGLGSPRLVNAYDKGQCEAVAYDSTGLELWFTCEDRNGPIARATCKTVQDDETGETTTIEQEGCACSATQSPLLLFMLIGAWLTRWYPRRRSLR